MRKLFVLFLTVAIVGSFLYGYLNANFTLALASVCLMTMALLWFFRVGFPRMQLREDIKSVLNGADTYKWPIEVAQQVGLMRARNAHEYREPTDDEIKQHTPDALKVSNEMRRMQRDKLLKVRDSGFEPKKKYSYMLA